MFVLSFKFSMYNAALPKVRWVLPDSYLDVKNKDYGGKDRKKNSYAFRLFASFSSL